MDFFSRASNGWTIAKNSFKVLEQNRQLILFPILSGTSMLLIVASFFFVLVNDSGAFFGEFSEKSSVAFYGSIFLYYLANYFIIVFFNTALTYCTGLYFKGEEPTLKKGLTFSATRIGVIFSWAVFAATVGTILKVIQENLGFIGKLLTGVLGAVFSIATYFVVPVLTFENVGPIDAFRRSANIMKEKWGESIGAGFSFILMEVLAIIFIAMIAISLAYFNFYAGVVAGVTLTALMLAVVSAVRSIFASAIYHNITGDPVSHFEEQFVSNLFLPK